ncbi:hypothetical protein D7B12_17810 [Salmonella enterica]|nr:hypothetical protein [Salmonella enterica]
MFQLKNFVSIAASMLNYVRSTTGKVTDLQPGSVTRTLLEAPAAEIEELYVQVFNGIKEAIPVAVFNSFQFDRLPAQYASGVVTIVADEPLTASIAIPAGTRFLARDGRIYEAVGDLEWIATEPKINVPVRSVMPGYSQNAAANEINDATLFPADKFTLSSSEMINGADSETDDARILRFSDYVAALSRGTETALLYAARYASLRDALGNITESVTRTSLTVNSGSVTVNIWGSNGSPSPELITHVTNLEQGYKDANGAIVPGYAAAGISCSVSAMREKAIDAILTVTFFKGYRADLAMRQNIRNTMASFLGGIMPGDFVYADDLRAAVLLVRNVETAKISMDANVQCNQDEVLTLGNIQFMNIIKVNLLVALKTGNTLPPEIQNDMIKRVNDWINGLQIGSIVSAGVVNQLFMIEKNKEMVYIYPDVKEIIVEVGDEFTMEDDDLKSAGPITIKMQDNT